MLREAAGNRAANEPPRALAQTIHGPRREVGLSAVKESYSRAGPNTMRRNLISLGPLSGDNTARPPPPSLLALLHAPWRCSPAPWQSVPEDPEPTEKVNLHLFFSPSSVEKQKQFAPPPPPHPVRHHQAILRRLALIRHHQGLAARRSRRSISRHRLLIQADPFAPSPPDPSRSLRAAPPGLARHRADPFAPSPSHPARHQADPFTPPPPDPQRVGRTAGLLILRLLRL